MELFQAFSNMHTRTTAAALRRLLAILKNPVRLKLFRSPSLIEAPSELQDKDAHTPSAYIKYQGVLLSYIK